jgi:hypothetical protein
VQRLKCSASLKSGPLTYLPMMVPLGLGSSIFMIESLAPQKNQARFLDEAQSHTARGRSRGSNLAFQISAKIQGVNAAYYQSPDFISPSLKSRAISLCAMGKVCAMRTEKKIIEFADYIVTIIVRQKKPPAADNDNEFYEFWNEELKDLYDRYDK